MSSGRQRKDGDVAPQTDYGRKIIRLSTMSKSCSRSGHPNAEVRSSVYPPSHPLATLPPSKPKEIPTKITSAMMMESARRRHRNMPARRGTTEVMCARVPTGSCASYWWWKSGSVVCRCHLPLLAATKSRDPWQRSRFRVRDWCWRSLCMRLSA